METKREQQRTRRINRREKGLCQDCGVPAVPGNSNCVKHKAERSAAQIRKKRKWMDNGKCGGCGRPLDDGMLSKSKSECIVCQDRNELRRLIIGRTH